MVATVRGVAISRMVVSMEEVTLSLSRAIEGAIVAHERAVVIVGAVRVTVLAISHTRLNSIQVDNVVRRHVTR